MYNNSSIKWGKIRREKGSANAKKETCSTSTQREKERKRVNISRRNVVHVVRINIELLISVYRESIVTICSICLSYNHVDSLTQTQYKHAIACTTTQRLDTIVDTQTHTRTAATLIFTSSNRDICHNRMVHTAGQIACQTILVNLHVYFVSVASVRVWVSHRSGRLCAIRKEQI